MLRVFHININLFWCPSPDNGNMCVNICSLFPFFTFTFHSISAAELSIAFFPTLIFLNIFHPVCAWVCGVFRMIFPWIFKHHIICARNYLIYFIALFYYSLTSPQINHQNVLSLSNSFLAIPKCVSIYIKKYYSLCMCTIIFHIFF